MRPRLRTGDRVRVKVPGRLLGIHGEVVERTGEIYRCYLVRHPHNHRYSSFFGEDLLLLKLKPLVLKESDD